MKYLHTAVRVEDLDAALDFYCNKMGLRELHRFEGNKADCTIVFLAAPGNDEAQIEVVHYRDPDERAAKGNFGHISYQVDNIYDTCWELMAQGLTLNMPPKDGFMAFVRLSAPLITFPLSCSRREGRFRQKSRGSLWKKSASGSFRCAH